MLVLRSDVETGGTLHRSYECLYLAAKGLQHHLPSVSDTLRLSHSSPPICSCDIFLNSCLTPEYIRIWLERRFRHRIQLWTMWLDSVFASINIPFFIFGYKICYHSISTWKYWLCRAFCDDAFSKWSNPKVHLSNVIVYWFCDGLVRLHWTTCKFMLVLWSLICDLLQGDFVFELFHLREFREELNRKHGRSSWGWTQTD